MVNESPKLRERLRVITPVLAEAIGIGLIALAGAMIYAPLGVALVGLGFINYSARRA